MACMSEKSYSNNEGQAPHQVIKYTHAEMGPKIPAVLNINTLKHAEQILCINLWKPDVCTNELKM